MSKWDDYSISEEEWKYLKEVTGEDIDNYNGYRMDVFLLTNKGILETYRKTKKVETSTENKGNIPSQDSKEDQTKKSMEELEKELKEKEAKLDAHCRKEYKKQESNTATEQNDGIDSKKFQDWKEKYIKDNPNDKEVQELVKEIERIKTAIEALEKNQPQVQATQQAQDKKADTKVETLEEKIEYAENVLIGYLGMRYEEEHPDENVNQGTWESDAYKQWVKNYGKTHPNDEDYKKYVTEFEKLKAEKQAQATQADTKANATTQAQAVTGGDIPVISDSTSEQSEKTDKQLSDTMVVDEASDDVKTEVIPDDEDNKNDQEEELELVREERLRSANSDENESKLDAIRLEALYQVGHISEDIYNKGKANPRESIAIINAKMPLKESQMAEYEAKFIDLAIEHEVELPPSLLAKAYNLLKEQAKEKSNEKASKKLQVVASRIDSLIEQAAKREGLFFTDITNIPDVYEGYMQMMAAREPDLDENSPIKGGITQVRDFLNSEISKYDSLMNLNREGLDAVELYERFDKLEAGMKKVELTDEHLQTLSSIKFTNEKGEPVAQFVDKDGNDTLEYTEGCKIKKGSQLETFVNLAKAQVLQEELGSTADVKEICTPERLQEQVSSLMYAASIVSKTEQGIGENLNAFTKDGKLDKEKLNKFVENISKEGVLTISPSVYEKTLDGAVDLTAAYADRLGQKVGKGKSVVLKVIDSVKDVDKRAAGRTIQSANKRQIRLEMLKRVAKRGISAFAISTGMTLGVAAVDAHVTGLTLGANKVAGLALGTALGVSLSLVQLHKWRKNKKAKGEPCGFKAMIKDRHLGPTLLTTALGSAALCFAVTGNPGMAMGLGYSAMGVGLTSGAVNTAIDVKQMGLSGVEAALWGVLEAGAGLGAAFAGRTAGTELVDAINSMFPDNKIFQHKGFINDYETVQKVVLDENASANAKSVVEQWYPGEENQQLLESRIASINKYLQANGITDVDPYRLLMEAHDAGALAPDNNLLHVQGGPDVNTHGSHKVFGSGWQQEYGFSKEQIDALAGIVQGDQVVLTSEALDVFRRVDPLVGQHNTVGHVGGAPTQNDGVLGYNSQDVAGRMTVGEQGNTHYTTYADDSAYKTIIEKVPFLREVIKPNEVVGLMGMVGVSGKTFGKKLADRAGALMDGVKNIFRKKDKPTPPKPIPPKPIPPKPIPPKPIPPKPIPPKPIPPKPIPPKPIPPKPIPPKPEPKKEEPKKEPKMEILKELLDEYKIVYGVDLYDFETGKFKGENEEQIKRSKERYKEYYGLVAAELEADEKRKDLGMTMFCMLRKNDLDRAVCNVDLSSAKVIPTTQAGKKYLEDIQAEGNEVRVWSDPAKQTRECWMRSNLSEENRTKLTLSHFTKLLAEVKKASPLVADGSRNPDLNIDFKNNPKGIVVVSTDKLLFGQQGETVSEPIKFTGNESYLEKELAVRQKLDELNGVKHNPKTNAVKARVENGQKGKANTTPAPSRPR